MSPQIIELLIFALIAFFLINKLLSVLGTTDTDEPERRRGYFGEPGGMKDVTEHVKEIEVIDGKQQSGIEALVVTKNIGAILQNYQQLYVKMPDFDMQRFILSAKSAFKMIIDAVNSGDQESIVHLVDKRYVKQAIEKLAEYGECKNCEVMDAKISELYMFGNNAFVKVLFTGQNIVSKMEKFSEEWTFSKNTNVQGNGWYLSNIEAV